LDRFYPNQDASTVDYALRRAVLGFAIGFIFLGDTTIAFNRLTAMVFPTHHRRVGVSGRLTDALFIHAFLRYFQVWTGRRLMVIFFALHVSACLYGTARQLIALGFIAAEAFDLKDAMNAAGKVSTK
jgi:hypothetical protein